MVRITAPRAAFAYILVAIFAVPFIWIERWTRRVSGGDWCERPGLVQKDWVVGKHFLLATATPLTVVGVAIVVWLLLRHERINRIVLGLALAGVVCMVIGYGLLIWQSQTAGLPRCY